VTEQQGRLGPGHRVAGRYQVARLVGAGEMGEVYDVRDIASGYAYALKLLKPEAVQSQDAWMALCNDARRASALETDAIAKAYEFQIEPSLGVPYVLGEYVTFPSLFSLVSPQMPMGLEDFESLLRVVAQAVELAHCNRLYHRSLKPHNIFVNHSGPRAWQVRITDFGVGAARACTPPPPGWTATPGWMCAEQADPSSPPSAAMDVYALGLVAFYAMTGRSPFNAFQTARPDLNMLWGEMTAPMGPASRRAASLGATLYPSLDPWFDRALAVSPSKRFSSVLEMSNALFAIAGSTTRSHSIVSLPQPVVSAKPPQGMGAAVAVATGHTAQPAQGDAMPQSAPSVQAATAQPAVPARAPMETLPSASAASSGSSGKTIAVVAGVVVVAAVAAGGALLYWSGAFSPKTPVATAGSADAPAQSASTDPATSAEPAGSAAAQDTKPDEPKPDEPKPDEPKPEEKPKDALVTFACSPACDEVMCDGKKVDDPAAGVRLESGSHSCTAKAAGHNPTTDKFNVTAGEDVKRELKLTKRVAGPPPKAPPKACVPTLLNPCK